MSPFKPYADLDPTGGEFEELLACRLVQDGILEKINLDQARSWYAKGTLEHLLQEMFPGRSVSVEWFETMRFSAKTLIIYENYDSTTPTAFICDGETDSEPLLGSPPAADVSIRNATFCVHWRPPTGEVTALLSVHCPPERLEEHLTSVLK
jgi:hypothetical protein